MRAASSVWLVLWYVWLCCAFAAAGYLAYSGVTGIGDLNPGEGGGIGPLRALLFRIVFAAGGAFAYWKLVVLGMRTLGEMIGQGPKRKARRTVAHLFYAVLCLAAVVASLPNPIGLFVTLASPQRASAAMPALSRSDLRRERATRVPSASGAIGS